MPNNKVAPTVDGFDNIDVFYLANTMAIRQLRHEVNQAEIYASVAKTYHKTEYQSPADRFPWTDYAATCQEAIKWIQHGIPKPNPQPTGGRIDIEAIKARCDIVTIIEGYTTLRKAGRNFTGKCPIHQDKNPSLTVYPEQQTWHCFGACNRGGDIFAFIQAVEHTDFQGAAAILGGR